MSVTGDDVSCPPCTLQKTPTQKNFMVPFLLYLLSNPTGSSAQSTVESSCLSRCAGITELLPHYEEGNPHAPCFQFNSKGSSVMSGCDTGYQRGVKVGCVDGCREGTENTLCFDATHHLSPSSMEAMTAVCSPFANLVPRPLVYDACNHGFRTGVSSSCSMSHHWITMEVARRKSEEDAKEASRQAAELEEMENRLLQAQRDMAEKARMANERAAAMAAAEQAATKERERRKEEAEKQKRGKVRGKK